MSVHMNNGMCGCMESEHDASSVLPHSTGDLHLGDTVAREGAAYT